MTVRINSVPADARGQYGNAIDLDIDVETTYNGFNNGRWIVRNYIRRPYRDLLRLHMARCKAEWPDGTKADWMAMFKLWRGSARKTIFDAMFAVDLSNGSTFVPYTDKENA